MQGMERAKAIRDYLAFAQSSLSPYEFIALKEAAKAISRGEKPEAIESFRPKNNSEAIEKLREVGELLLVETPSGKREIDLTMKFDSPIPAWAIVFGLKQDESRNVYLSTNFKYSTIDTIKKGSNNDGVFFLFNMFKADETPKANKARIQLVLNELADQGVQSWNIIRKGTTEAKVAQTNLHRDAKADQERYGQKKIIDDAKAKTTPIEKTTVKYTDHPIAKKIEAYRKTLIGCPTLENINAVADIAFDECMKYAASPENVAISEQLDDGDSELDKRLSLQALLRQKYQWAIGEEKEAIRVEHDALKAGNLKWCDEDSPRLQGESAAAMAAFLSKIRAATSMTEDEVRKSAIANPRQHNAKTVAKWMRVYPADFVDAMASKPLTLSYVDRSYFSDNASGPALALSRAPDPKTIIHELGHDLECRCPAILALEAEFYERRRGGEKFQKLKDITGKNFASDEITIKDHYLNPYMGKWYGGEAYELVSMGFELFFTNPKKLAQDREFFKFILGILLMVTP